MNYWLMKTEPNVFSIDDLKKQKISGWEGIRNYQVRNYLRDDFKIGDLAFIYHSNEKPIGIAGIGRVVKESYPDDTALDPSSNYYFEKATKAKNPWVMVDIKFERKFSEVITLDDLKQKSGLEEMRVIKKGMRTSIQPVTLKEWNIVLKMSS